MSVPFMPLPQVKSGETADIYFLRTHQILTEDDLNPVVTMDIFCRNHGILSGMKEVRGLLWNLMESHDISSLSDGEHVHPMDSVLRITGPYLPFCIYETAYLGMLAAGTGWATAARQVVEAAAGTPVLSFGARHQHPNVAGPMEYASVVGGCIATSTTIGSTWAGKQPSGTMPHSLIISYGDTLDAALAFDEFIDQGVNRVILVDTFHDEIEEAIRVCANMTSPVWGVRLDTPSERGGVTVALVKEMRARLDLAGFPEVKIVVSGGMDPKRIAEFVAHRAPVDVFGVGSFISHASPIDYTADIKVIDGVPIAKRGRIPGLAENSRLKTWK